MTVALADADVPRIVLDTNAVLDGWVFRDAGAQALVAAVESGSVRWVACSVMRDELARTLGYTRLAKWTPDSERMLTIFDQRAQMFPSPATLPSLRCSDLDDQVFFDLALATGARWLLTQDRALLRLARRARALGLQILRPTLWRTN